MIKSILISLMITSLIFSQAFSCDISGIGGFAPENNLRIPVIEKSWKMILKTYHLNDGQNLPFANAQS